MSSVRVLVTKRILREGKSPTFESRTSSSNLSYRRVNSDRCQGLLLIELSNFGTFKDYSEIEKKTLFKVDRVTVLSLRPLTPTGQWYPYCD